MKLNQLYYFKTVCKYNNITKAAEHLHVSQPAITHAIRELERELGIRLFKRTNKNVSLTQEGVLFFQKSSDILSELESLVDEMRDLGELHRAVIRVGVPPAIGTVIHPQMEIAASQKFGIGLEIVEMSSEEAEFALYNDELDLIVLLVEDKFYPRLEYKVLKKSSLHFLTNKNHPLASRKSIGIPELQNERIILFYPGKIIEDIFHEYHITPKYILHSNQILTIQRYICSGLASTLQFPEVFMHVGNIQRIPVTPYVRLDIAIGKKRGKRLPSAAFQLYHYLAEHPEVILS